MPWYGDHIRLFRQKVAQEWDDVFAEIRIGVNYYFSPYTGLVSGSAERK